MTYGIDRGKHLLIQKRYGQCSVLHQLRCGQCNVDQRGQINGDDYRALIANGVTPEQIYEMNSKYLMEQLGRNP